MKFDFFKEITMGGLSKEKLLEELSHAGVQFNHYAHRLFDHPDFSPPLQTEKVNLVKASLKDLQLTENCSFEEFSSQAFKFGLKLCPLYLAAFLRLAYLDQNEGPYLTIASGEIKDKNFPRGFYLRNFENSLWLRGYNADGFSGWPEANEFIFIK
ncbi:MAG: hypothetical protein AB7I27_16910 [Bacteriovoracaceae bacterium]